MEGDGGDNGYDAFYETIGSVVMGRYTYEEVLALSEVSPMRSANICAFSLGTAARSACTVYNRGGRYAHSPALKQTSDGDVWIVGGGILVQAVLAKKLLDEIEVAIIPKILGEGIPLFPTGTVPSQFKMVRTQTLGQIISIRYEVQTAAQRTHPRMSR